MGEDELERFKSEINLSEFAAGHGYRLDKRESWRGGAVMRHEGTDDKIIITRAAHDGHWVYCSVRDPADAGSIIDFLQKRKGGHLGQIRQALRGWIGIGEDFPARPPAASFVREVVATEKDRGQVMAAYAAMERAPAHPYLLKERMIPVETLSSKRFAGQVRIDARGNAVFPHLDEKGLCGYELKNFGFTGFAKGGKKGLWFSRAFGGDARLVLCESAIDALSHHALKGDRRTRYASIGGQVNPEQPALLARAVAKMGRGAEIVAAMDNNAAGRRLAALLEEAVRASSRDDLFYRLDLPAEEGADWNDVLRAALPRSDAGPRSSFPAALERGSGAQPPSNE